MLQIAFGGNKGAAGFGHLGTVNRQEAVGADARWDAEAAFVQHGWPEQGMEIENIFADKVHQLGIGIRFPVGVEIQAFFFSQCLEGAHVTDRRIQPDVKILAWGIWNGETKIGGITRDIPVAQFVLARRAQPFLHLIGRFVLQHRNTIRGAPCEITQKLLAAWIRELEEVML